MSVNNELIKLNGIENLLSNIGNKIKDNQILMRCLQYDSANALSPSLPDVTIQEIKKLVGKGLNPASEQRLYKQGFYDDIITDPRTEIRYFIPVFSPNNIYLSGVDICFQIVVHNTKWDLDDNRIKPIVMINEILKDFNGTDDLGGIGTLQLKSPIKLMYYNKSFSGYFMVLSTRSV